MGHYPKSLDGRQEATDHRIEHLRDESGRGLLLVEVLAERWVVGERELGGIVRCKFTLVDGGATDARA
ncbi:hypothetical protein [Streptomyces fagopyri]|uniref:hypothetical protein n=1 Tax=Streptomyces fagopyri TaxID=2662397 RepID=UPI00371FD4D8